MYCIPFRRSMRNGMLSTAIQASAREMGFVINVNSDQRLKNYNKDSKQHFCSGKRQFFNVFYNNKINKFIFVSKYGNL